MGRPRKTYTKDQISKAIDGSLGVVSTIAQRLGCGWTCAMKNIKDHGLEGELNEQLEVSLDFAESQLHSAIQDEDLTAIIFYLKTKGKKRGYSERQEIDHTSKGDKIQQQQIHVSIDGKDINLGT